MSVVMICIWYFRLVCLYSFLWSGLPTKPIIQHTHSKLPCICASLCILWNATLYTDGILYPSHITAWRSLNCPIHQCQTIGMYILKSQLNLCFLFLQFDLPAHIYSFSFTKLQNHIKKIWKYSFCNYVAQKNPYAML